MFDKKYSFVLVLVLIVSFFCGSIFSSFFTIPSASAQTKKEYKVLEFKKVAVGKRDKMEGDLNKYASEGWDVVSISSTDWQVKSSTVLIHTVILVRETAIK